MALTYCLNPEHPFHKLPPWFIAADPAPYCPECRKKPKPRMRLVDGAWRTVSTDAQ